MMSKKLPSSQGKFGFALVLSMICLMLSVISPFKSTGQLITEPFNYTADAANGLAKQSSSAWTIANSGDSVLVTAGSLSYGNLPTSTGNKVAYDGAGTDYLRVFTSQTSGTVYASFIMNISALGSLGTAGGYTLMFAQSTSYASCIWLRKSSVDATKFNIGISTRSNSTVTWLSTDYTVGTSYFIVIGYQIVTGTGNDVSKLWVNPSLGNISEPTPDATPSAGTDMTNISGFLIRQDAASTTPFIQLDELKIATSWSTVTPASTSPNITGAATATAFTTTYGTASTAQSFSISGTNLTADITATAPTGFEVSSDGTNYGGTATFTQSSGSTSGSLRVRLKANAAVSGSYNSQNIVLSSTGATSVNIATSSSGNSVSTKGLTITGLTAQDKNYDGTTTASVTGTPAYVGLVNSESFSVTGSVSWVFPSAAVGNNYTLTRSGSYNAPSTNYTVTQPTLTASILLAAPAITSSLTASGTYATDFTYQITASGNPTSFSTSTLPSGFSLDITGTISGTPSAIGTYNVDITATNSVGSDTKTLVITINKAGQTITFGPLATRYTGDAPFSLSATSSAGLTVSYSSSNTSVATISGSTVTVVGAGTTTITASQAGNSYYNAANSVNQTLEVQSLVSPVVNSGGTPVALSTTYGTASTATSFTVLGAGLTDNILITAPIGFEVSKTDASSGFAATQTLTQSGGSVAETTIYVRLKSTAAANTYNSAVAITSTDATTVNVNIPTSTVNTLALTISGISAVSRTYDATTTASFTGLPTLNGVINSDDVSIGGTTSANFATAAVGTGKAVTVSGYTLTGTAASNYSLTQPSGLAADITAASLTVTGAVAADKVYDGNTTASISGATLNGVFASENVSLSLNGTFATANAGTAISVSLSITGTGVSNYTLIQPGITANITKANQTITFGAITPKTTTSADFAPGATSATSATNTITYTSSNTAVATIVSGNIHIVGVGTSTITASQAGSDNYNAAADQTQLLTVTLAPVSIVAWDVNGYSNYGSSPQSPTTSNSNVTIVGLTRGSGVSSSGTGAAANTWGGYNFDKTSYDSAVAGNDFITFSITPNAGYVMNLRQIPAHNIRRSSTGANRGRWQYKVGNGSFVDLGSDISWSSSTSPYNAQSLIDLSAINNLQNIAPQTTVTFRLVIWCSGVTGAGTWYINNQTGNDMEVLGNIFGYPVLSTPTITSVTNNQADLGATLVSSDGSNITERGTVWGTSASPTTNALAEGGTSLSAYSHTRTGMSPNTQIYMRGYAINNLGTGYSSDRSFYTLANVPDAPTVGSPTSASLSVSVNANGNPTSTQFAIQEVGGLYVQADGTLGASAVWNTASGWGTIAVTGLNASTAYTFQVKARNAENVETTFGISAGATTNAPAATINYVGTPSALSTTYSTASTTTIITLSGVYLTEDITVTAPSGFEISQTSATSGFANTQTVAQTSGSISNTVIYIRLAANANVGSYSGNLQLSSAGVTTINVALANSTVSTLGITITGISAANKTYDGTTAALISGTAQLVGVVGSDDVSLSGTPTATFNNKNVGTNKTVVLSGYTLSGVASNNYSLTQPTGFTASITEATLEVSGVVAANKTYDGNMNATITNTGTLSGVIGSDVVSVSSTGTFDFPDAAPDINVTLSLTGADAANYILTQPGITATINKADQTITFAALPVRTTSETTFTLNATASSGFTIEYTSSNPAVATVTGNVVTIVGAGSTVITASQLGDDNYNEAPQISQTQLVVTSIAKWTFEGVTFSSTAATSPSLTSGNTIADQGVQTTGSTFGGNHASTSTVWSTASGNNSTKGLNANYWGVGDYFQFKINTSGYKNLILSFDQTGSNTGPKNFKLQYSTNGTTFTDYANYTVSNDSWSPTLYKSISNKYYDLSTLVSLNNQSNLYFRMARLDTAAISGNAGTGGTSRIDNVSLSGFPCVSTSSSETTTACDSYSWNGNTYTASGTYTYVTRNTSGCDSTVTLNLTIQSSTHNATTASVCDSYTWTANGQTYTSSGNYTYNYTNGNGCASVDTLHLTITASDNNITTASVCDSYVWSVNGQTYTTSGTYTSVSGCHTETLNLTITSSDNNTTTESACDSYVWSVNGQTYTSSGTYTSVSGCHTETLNLTITASTNTPTTASVCDSYVWSVNGQTYTTSGTYTSVSGCHTETLNLTITASTNTPTTVSACDSYLWSVNGQAYTTSGTYTSVSGCNTNTLNLTIIASTTTPTTVSVCGSYVWSANGQTYTTSGTYTSVSGCNTRTLNLTIKSATSSTTNVSICASNAPYRWNGTNYSASGTYTWNGTNAQGCDSIARLVLSVTPYLSTPIATVTQPTCSSTGSITINSPLGAGLTYSIGGAYQSSNVFSGITQGGSYALSVLSGAGCTSQYTGLAIMNDQPVLPGNVIVTGQVNVCNLIGTASTATYTASSVGATGYIWTLPANTTLVSGQGTSTIVVAFLNGFQTQTIKQIKVTASSSCGFSSQKVFYLAAQLPVTPSAITASTTNVCPSIGTNVPITYTIPKVQGASIYYWSAQNGTTNISHPNGSGENDTVITVTFASNFSSSSITVQAVNNCGTSGTRSLFVSRNNPSQPSLISGPVNACEYSGSTGNNATYYVNAASNVNSYAWSFPQGVTIVSGQGTNQVVVKYPQGFTGGTISVTATNGCGTSSARTLSIASYNAATPGNIDVISVAACPNRVYSYTIASVPSNATSLLWTVPAGATLLTGQGTTSITVSYPSTAFTGTVLVQGVNNCSLSSAKSATVKLPPCPSGFTGTNPTTRNAEAIEVKGMSVKVYPNPTTSNFNVQVNSGNVEVVKLKVMDAQGRAIRTLTIAPYQTVNLGADLKAGAYLIEMRQGKEVRVERLIKF